MEIGNIRMQNKGSDIEELMLDLTSRIGKVLDALPETGRGRHIANPLIRPGTFLFPTIQKRALIRVRKILSTS